MFAPLSPGSSASNIKRIARTSVSRLRPLSDAPRNGPSEPLCSCPHVKTTMPGRLTLSTAPADTAPADTAEADTRGPCTRPPGRARRRWARRIDQPRVRRAAASAGNDGTASCQLRWSRLVCMPIVVRLLCRQPVRGPMEVRFSRARSRPGLNAGCTSLRYWACSGGSM